MHIIKRGVEFLGETFTGNDTVSMGESNNEEVTDLDDHGGFAERRGWMPDLRLVSSPGTPISMPAARDVFQLLPDDSWRLRSLRLFRCPGNDNRTLAPRARHSDAGKGYCMNNPALLATIMFQWENRKMKKLLILMILAMLLAGAAGCNICDWWRRGPNYQQCQPAVMYSNPCPTVSTCEPCAGAPVVTPGPETYRPVTP